MFKQFISRREKKVLCFFSSCRWVWAQKKLKVQFFMKIEHSSFYFNVELNPPQSNLLWFLSRSINSKIQWKFLPVQSLKALWMQRLHCDPLSIIHGIEKMKIYYIRYARFYLFLPQKFVSNRNLMLLSAIKLL